MSLTETKKIDKIEVVENNSIQVRTATIIEKDGVEIAKTYHRRVVAPTDSIENEDLRVQAIANAIWTEEVIAKYKQDQLEKIVATK
jgi:hypothetical protein